MNTNLEKQFLEKLKNRRKLLLQTTRQRIQQSRDELKSCKNAVIQNHLLHEQILFMSHQINHLLNDIESIQDESELNYKEARLFEDKYHNELLLNQKVFADYKFEQEQRKALESLVTKADKAMCELRTQLGARDSQILQLKKELKQQRAIIRKLNNHE